MEQDQDDGEKIASLLQTLPSYTYQALVDPSNQPPPALQHQLTQCSPIKSINALPTYLKRMEDAVSSLHHHPSPTSLRPDGSSVANSVTDVIAFVRQQRLPPPLTSSSKDSSANKSKMSNQGGGAAAAAADHHPHRQPSKTQAPSSFSATVPSTGWSPSIVDTVPLQQNDEAGVKEGDDTYNVVSLRRYCFYSADRLQLKRAMNEIRLHHLATSACSSFAAGGEESEHEKEKNGNYDDGLPIGGRHNILPFLGYVRESLALRRRRSSLSSRHQQEILGLVLPFCPTGNLRERILCDARIGERDIMRCSQELVAAIAHCHSLNILHRNVVLDAGNGSCSHLTWSFHPKLP